MSPPPGGLGGRGGVWAPPARVGGRRLALLLPWGPWAAGGPGGPRARCAHQHREMPAPVEGESGG